MSLCWKRLAPGEYVAAVPGTDRCGDPLRFSISRITSEFYGDTSWHLTYPGERSPDTVACTLGLAKSFAEKHATETL